MSDDLTCKLCMKKFKFQSAREFHFDIIHNFRIYMCQICEHTKDHPQKGISYSYFELQDHIYKLHDQNPYRSLDYLNMF